MVGEQDARQSGLEDLDAAIAAGVDDPRAFWARAMLQIMARGDEKKAIEDLTRAVELAPLHGGYRANLAQVLCGMSLRTSGLTLQMGADEEKLEADDEALSQAELHFGLACELEPENDLLRETREAFLELLQKKSGTK